MAERPGDRAASDKLVRDPAGGLERLREIMRRLRDPADGCAWDLKQDFASIAPYTIEEAYEVADAIERGSMADLTEELGDLLLQVVYHAQIAEEGALFSFEDVARAVSDKMVRRHPHVFSDAKSADWEAIKAAERAEKRARDGASPPEESVLDAVPRALPSLTRAEKLQKRAAQVGFDWADAGPVLDKIAEEARELTQAAAVETADRVEDEFGDLLFAVVNLARRLKVDPEKALARTNAKFTRRFRAIEAGLAATGRDLESATLEEMDALWDAAKRQEAADAAG